MATIRSRRNKSTELALVKIFRLNGITGWRRHLDLPGHPDFIFREQKLAVFVDGCFWHGCPRCYQRPRSNQPFWDAKVARNRARDLEVARELRQRGWRVVRLWEHELRKPARILARLKAIVRVRENVRPSNSGLRVSGMTFVGRIRTFS